jgi:transcriptional regulator with XRE-family HTH domain
VPTTPVERLKTPLRQLRVILGDFGAPLSQEEFAQASGLSLTTVRSIENERRPLSPDCLRTIKKKLFVEWDQTNGQWCPIWDKTRLYTKEDAQASVAFPPIDPVRKLMIRKLQERLRSICEASQPQDFVGRVMHLNALLADHARESGLNVDLEPTEPIWILSPEAKETPGGVIRKMLRPEYKEQTRMQRHSKERTAQKKVGKNKRTLSAPKRMKAKNSVKKRATKKTGDPLW